MHALLVAPLSTGLGVTHVEISVVYYRTGYVPKDYASPADYTIRALPESSRAAQCPSFALQLAGAKKVQEVLTRPGMLDVSSRLQRVLRLRDSWACIWSLDADGGAGADEAVRRAQELVLKPQRDRENVPPFIAQLPVQERAAWVAMELIRPPRGVCAYLVRSGAGRVSARVMSEFGVYKWALFGEGMEVREEQAGCLVRTKADDVDEGGVDAVDSVLLVDSQGRSSRIGIDCANAIARRSKLECNTRHDMLPYVHRSVDARRDMGNLSI